MLQTCRALAVSTNLAGDEVMTEISAYTRMVALTRDEFAKVFEVVPHVRNLKTLCVREVERRLREEGWKGVPQWEMIKKYCVQKRIRIMDREGNVGGPNAIGEGGAASDPKGQGQGGQSARGTTW